MATKSLIGNDVGFCYIRCLGNLEVQGAFKTLEVCGY